MIHVRLAEVITRKASSNNHSDQWGDSHGIAHFGDEPVDRPSLDVQSLHDHLHTDASERCHEDDHDEGSCLLIPLSRLYNGDGGRKMSSLVHLNKEVIVR